MNGVLENSYAWTGSFVEALSSLTCDVASLIYESLSITSNASETVPVAGGDKALPKIPQVVQEVASFFAFDDFQYLLLKIFLALIVGNVCLIYVAWYIYGDRITERFMTPSTSPEELKRSVLDLKLPTEHSQRYS